MHPRNPPFRLLAISQLAALPIAALDPAAWFAALAAAGVDGVQLREKHLSDRALYQLAVQAHAALGLGKPPRPAAGWPAEPDAGRGGEPPVEPSLLINGRADIALAAGADGVHLPAAGVPMAALRARFGPALRIGVSTHDPAEVALARLAGADYVVFGPVYPTPGKPGITPTGLAGLSAAVAAAGGAAGASAGRAAGAAASRAAGAAPEAAGEAAPEAAAGTGGAHSAGAGSDGRAGNKRREIAVYALGGVTLERFAEIAAAGAAGVAAIRLFQSVAGLDGVVAAARRCFR